MDEASPQVLSEDECWDFLGTEEFGRLGFRLVDEIHIVPINYAVESRTLLFRTAPGDKLLAAAMGAQVAFETDRIADERGISVVVRGPARILPEDEAHRAEPWAVTDAPAAFVDQQLRAIVGLELQVERVEAKAKLSQNRSVEDRAGVVAGLRAAGGAREALVADAMDL